MAEDLLDAIRDQLANFSVGLVEQVSGAGSKVKGSGILVSIEGRRGILTCGHVAETYDKLTEIGLARFITGERQNRIINIADAHHIIVESSAQWSETELDLAFTYLNPEVANSIAHQSLFLNLELNRERIERGEPGGCHSVDVMFGLVDEYSQKPFVENGQFVSPMRAVIYRGRMHTGVNALLRFQTIDEDPAKLPESFGGLSGSGLWRVHFRDYGDGRFEITEKRLWGIASWQMDKQNNTGAVAGQAWDRIDQGLIPVIRDNLRF